MLKRLSLEMDWNSIVPTCPRLALQAIESIDLVVGGQLVDRIPGEWLDIDSQLNHCGQEKARMDTLHSGYLVLDTGSSDQFHTRCYVDLPLYFSKHPANALPLLFLPGVEVVVFITFRSYVMIGVAAEEQELGGETVTTYRPVFTPEDVTRYIPSNQPLVDEVTNTAGAILIAAIPNTYKTAQTTPWNRVPDDTLYSYIRFTEPEVVLEEYSNYYTFEPSDLLTQDILGPLQASASTGHLVSCATGMRPAAGLIAAQERPIRIRGGRKRWSGGETTVGSQQEFDREFPTELGQLVVHSPGVTVNLANVRVFAEVAFLSDDDLKYYKAKNKVHLIEQVKWEEYISPAELSLAVPNVHMCRYLVVTAQPWSTRGTTRPFYEYSPGETLTSFELKLDGWVYGQKSIPRSGQYYQNVTLYQACFRGSSSAQTNGPTAVLPFSLFLQPRSIQPSGECSFANLKSAQLELALGPELDPNNVFIRIYAVYYNFIEFGPDHVLLAVE
jgi:hypothetical protein